MKKLLLIDFNYLYNRYYYVAKLKQDDTNTILFNMLVGFLSKVDEKQFQVVLCVDGKYTRNKDICTDYKNNRGDKSSVYANFDNHLRGLAKLNNRWIILRNEEAEADELIAYICKTCPNRDILIYSGDKDLIQLTTYENVQISTEFKEGKFHLLTVDDIHKKFKGLEDIDKLLVYRVLCGDPSDNLKPPIPRLQMTKKAVIINSIPKQVSFDRHVWENLIENLEDKILAGKVKDNIDIIERNFKLMSLLDFTGKDYLANFKRIVA